MADDFGGLAADAGVDPVEDEHGVGFRAQNQLDGQGQARELSARGDPGNGRNSSPTFDRQGIPSRPDRWRRRVAGLDRLDANLNRVFHVQLVKVFTSCPSRARLVADLAQRIGRPPIPPKCSRSTPAATGLSAHRSRASCSRSTKYALMVSPELHRERGAVLPLEPVHGCEPGFDSIQLVFVVLTVAVVAGGERGIFELNISCLTVSLDPFQARIMAAISMPVEQLTQPGAARILHFRTGCRGFRWKAGRASPR